MLESIFIGLIDYFTFQNTIFLLVGVFIGVLFGAIPGLNANIAMVLFLPITMSFDALTVITFMLGIYTGGKFGGSITAILIGTPGTNGAIATMLDGYPMAQMGKGRTAVQIALYASTFGSFVSAIVLLACTPLLAELALKFGPPEYFLLGLLGLLIIASISDNIFAGIMMGAFGFFFSTVGMDGITGARRFTFGNMYLLNGLPLVAIMIGIFAFTSILKKVTESKREYEEIKSTNSKDDRLSFREFRRLLPVISKSTVIGTLVGAMPGAGANIAAFLAYGSAKNHSKNPESFGKGNPEGVAAPEAGNSAVSGSSLIPMLTLGVPGAPAAATLMVIFQLKGLPCGPTLMTEHAVTVYVIIMVLILTALIMLIECNFLTNVFIKIAVVPNFLLVTVLPLACVAGVYAVSNRMIDLYIMMVFTLFGHVTAKYMNVNAAPLVLGYILGPIADKNLRRSMVMSQNSLSIFITRPLCIILIALILVYFISSLLNNNKKKEKKKDPQVAM